MYRCLRYDILFDQWVGFAQQQHKQHCYFESILYDYDYMILNFDDDDDDDDYEWSCFVLKGMSCYIPAMLRFD